MMFLLFKLLLATAVVLLCYALYRQLKSGPRRDAPDQRGSIDPRRVAEAEYSIVDEEEVEREDRG